MLFMLFKGHAHLGIISLSHGITINPKAHFGVKLIHPQANSENQ